MHEFSSNTVKPRKFSNKGLGIIWKIFGPFRNEQSGLRTPGGAKNQYNEQFWNIFAQSMIGWFDISKERVKCQLTWYTWCDLMRVPCERTFQWNYLFAIKNVRYVISPVHWYLPVQIPFKNHSILLIASDQFNPENPTRANILWKIFPKVIVKILKSWELMFWHVCTPSKKKFSDIFTHF